VHDRQIGRWMSHINLLGPFVPAGDVEEVLPLLVEACGSVMPFAVRLARFHSRRQGYSKNGLSRLVGPRR